VERLGFARAQAALTGRPGYAPRDRLKLCIDGDLNRIRSSRRLERETHRHVELIGLLRKLRPDVKTIADFRNQNAKALPALFRELVLLGQQLDRFGAALLALDGSTCKAVNNTHQHFTQTTLEKALKETLGVERRRAVADLGSSHGHAITACERPGLKPLGPTPPRQPTPRGASGARSASARTRNRTATGARGERSCPGDVRRPSWAAIFAPPPPPHASEVL
jgi:transposase